MIPRLLTRTHYQVDEPAYLRLLVLRCTSGTRSEYRERVASRLVEEVRNIGGGMNVAAAKYAVDLGRAAGLINANHVWTEKGHLLNLIAGGGESIQEGNLTLREKIFFFHLFLDSDGAAIVYFLRELGVRGRLPENHNDWNAIANDLFLWSFRSYYALTTDLATRTRIRQVVNQRETRPFSGRSGEHQCFLHVQLLYRLGLIGKSGPEDSRTYVAAGSVGARAA